MFNECPLYLTKTGLNVTSSFLDQNNAKSKCQCKNEFIYIRDFEAVQNRRSRVLLGSFSIDDDNGSENVSFKMNFRYFNPCRVYSNLLKMASVGEFPWS